MRWKVSTEVMIIMNSSVTEWGLFICNNKRNIHTIPADKHLLTFNPAYIPQDCCWASADVPNFYSWPEIKQKVFKATGGQGTALNYIHMYVYYYRPFLHTDGSPPLRAWQEFLKVFLFSLGDLCPSAEDTELYIKREEKRRKEKPQNWCLLAYILIVINLIHSSYYPVSWRKPPDKMNIEDSPHIFKKSTVPSPQLFLLLLHLWRPPLSPVTQQTEERKSQNSLKRNQTEEELWLHAR